MHGLRGSFGVPARWRAVVPLTAALSVAALVAVDAPAQARAAADTAAAPTTSSTEPLTAPDEASARTIARLEDRPVEVLAQRTEFGSVFVLPDGTMATGQGSGPVWVRRGGDGTHEADWAAVDLTLKSGEDGRVRPVAQSGDLTFAGASDGAAPVDLVTTTDPATGAVAHVRWAGALPAPRLEGRRAVYEDVADDVDLVLEATSTGFEQFFVINEAPSDGELPQLPMSVVTEGADLQASDDGDLSVVADGQVLASAATPLMWDADADQGRAFPVTEVRPAETADAARLSPMPAWVLEEDHGASVSDQDSAPRADSSADIAPAPAVGDALAEDVEQVVVQRDVQQVSANVAEVTLAPQAEFLQDADTTYPVVVDPDVNFAWGFDTYVLSGYSNTRDAQTELDIGTYDGGAHVARTFIHFPVGAIAGKEIIGARLELYNFYSWSCAAAGWEVWNVYAANASTVWSNQPGWVNRYATSSDTHGYSTSCGGDWSNADVKAFAVDWARTNETEGHVGIRAANESDNAGWKRFLSANNGSGVPSIWVTYDSVPNAPTGLQVSGSPTPSANGAWTATKTPRLSATLSDPDGGLVDANFSVLEGSTQIWAATSALGNSGSVGSVTVPAGKLAEGHTYKVEVRTSDHYALSAPASLTFGVDTTAPQAPTVSSATFADGSQWVGEPGQEASFTVGLPTDTTVSAYRWALDKTPDPAQQVSAAGGASATLKLTPKDAGRHVLQVQTVDRAGNLSGITRYTFRVGQAGIVAPLDGARVVRQVRLSVEGRSDLRYVSFEWRRGPDATVVSDVPAANLRTSSGAVWDARWQALPTGTGYTTWDAGAELGFIGGPAQVRARLSALPDGSSSTVTQWVSVVVDPDADGAATTQIGPGSVNLLTGDHSLSVTDAEEFGLSLVRTTSSRDADSGYELQPNGVAKEVQEATTLTGAATDSAALSLSTTRFHSGTSSYKLVGKNATTDTFASLGGGEGGMRAGLRAGRSYRISGWIYVPAATGLTPQYSRGLSLTVIIRVGTGAYSVGVISPKASVVDAWQQISVDYTVPAGTTEAFVRMYSGFSSSTKDVYFDDLQVQELWSPFGPEWALGTADAASGTAYTRITKPYDDVAAVELTGGGAVWFTLGDGGAWWPEPGAESLTLSSTSANSWRLTELDGTVTDFARTGTTGDFPVQSSSPPGAAGAVRQVYDVAGLPGVSRLSRLIAPIEPGVDGWVDGKSGNLQACTTATPARGCEVMDLDYATTTTATGSAVGSYNGRVATVSVWTWNGAAMVKTPVASYAYDATGRLRQVYDPRIVAAGSLAQVTVYDYDSASRLKSVTAPGEFPYEYVYGPAGKTKTGAGDWIDPAPGRLLKVSRASLEPGTTSTAGPTNTTTIVYGVPLSRADGGPYDLDPAASAHWAQQDGPTDATAIFGPLDDPTVTSATASAPGPDGYKPATVSYLNASGLEVNTASPAAANAPVEGFIDTTEYDTRGNVVRALDATNRLLALHKLPDATSMLAAWGLETRTDVELAQLLDTRTSYSDDGLDVLSTTGPIQLLAVANDPNDKRLLRARTRNTYDEGKPDAATYHLLTTSTVDGTDATLTESVDSIVTTTGYDPIDGADRLGATSGWVHKQATRVTVDAGQPMALTSTVLYDARARAIRSSKPGSTGTDAATTMSVFYTAETNTEDAACGNRPEWAGQPCVTKAAGPVTGHDPARMSDDLPVKRVEAYNAFGSPTVVSDSAGTGANRVTRTSTTTYDAADRVLTVALSGTGTSAGAAVATTRTTYDPATGDVTKNASLDAAGNETAAVLKEYDKLGRLTKYTDATGAWTKTTYDRLGQPLQVTDSLGTTRTYTYDRTLEPRGYVTKLSDSVAGDIVPTWGPDGQLEAQTMPGGITLTIGYDTARVPVARTYTRTSDNTVIAADNVVENHRGQWITHTTTDVGTRSYAYDRLGRLTCVDDVAAGANEHTSRVYGYDTHTNRTSLTATIGGAAADCTGSTGTATTYAYDSADRLVRTSGANGSTWTYDALGRTTTMPTADGATTATTSYFVNDLVAAQEVPGAQKTTWTLDPLQRLSAQNTYAWVTGAWANSTESVNHYDGDSDEPSWIADDITQPDKISRYVEGADGNLAVQTSKTGARVVQFVDLHGDVIATVPIPDDQTAIDTTAVVRTSYDEFGAPAAMTSGGTTNAPPARYGWLGAAQRSADTPSGAVLMGVRLYAPRLGRFLQTDPVAGGSANTYDYCNADPVNCTDLDGRIAVPIAPAVAVAIAALVAVAAFYEWCKRMPGHCQIAMPALPRPVIPFPRSGTKTDRSHQHTPYLVYEIHSTKGETYKYGISRVGMSRPNSQLPACVKYFGSGCRVTKVANVKGWFAARMVEASLITAYTVHNKKCPPGQAKSCR